MKTFLITDTHLWHKMQWERGYRPENFTELILENCRRMIAPRDLVFHLGDVAFGQRSLHKPTLQSLPGLWTLILGNHDHESNAWYIDAGFVAVCDAMVHRKVLLTHRPAPELPTGAVLNIHGHLHDDSHRDGEYVKQPWHRLLALERTRYKPVLWEDFVNVESIDLDSDAGVRGAASDPRSTTGM